MSEVLYIDTIIICVLICLGGIIGGLLYNLIKMRIHFPKKISREKASMPDTKLAILAVYCLD
jgi:hypothetical protein